MLNRVIMMGRLAHSPEVKDGETKVARLRLAVQRDVKTKDGTDADFFDVVAFGKTADFAGQYLTKGRQVLVEGRLQTRSYTDKDNNKRTAVQIIADRLYFADSKPQAEEREPFLTEPPREIPESTKAYGKRIEEALKTPLVPEVVDDDEPLPF